jgi:hypothetical protein
MAPEPPSRRVGSGEVIALIEQRHIHALRAQTLQPSCRAYPLPGPLHIVNIPRIAGYYGLVSLVVNANRTPVAEGGRLLPAI